MPICAVLEDPKLSDAISYGRSHNARSCSAKSTYNNAYNNAMSDKADAKALNKPDSQPDLIFERFVYISFILLINDLLINDIPLDYLGSGCISHFNQLISSAQLGTQQTKQNIQSI